MKFFDDEWHETRVKRIDETITEPGRLNVSPVEGYRSVWGGGSGKGHAEIHAEAILRKTPVCDTINNYGIQSMVFVTAGKSLEQYEKEIENEKRNA